MLKTGQKIIPIFYHIDPSDVRFIKGKYAHAFSEHEKKGRYTTEKLDEWKGALCSSSLLSGYLVSNNEDEATVLKSIVNCALKIMKKTPLWVAEHPLGLDELVQGFESVAREETVDIRGIVGMGGSGKTTLAKELFNRNLSLFGRCSFVFDVRDAASRKALPDKQKKLLADLGVRHEPFDHVDEGKVFLADHLSSHQVLIVLDDVDHIDQLNTLLPNKDKLGSHSLVIVTTRELDVLISWGLSLPCIYRMPGLNRSHAEQLFCWHAFLQPSPPPEFGTLVEEFLKACDGLPLSLKVMGAQLYGRKSKDYWKSQLRKILKKLPGEIQQRLQVSYDALDEEQRDMFLDVACFFIGEEKERAIAVWDGSGWIGLHGFETLLNKCLVELVEEPVYRVLEFVVEKRMEKRIRMHDHLRDMGREIASRHSPYRLWCPQQIDKLKQSTKREPIRGIQPADSFVAFKKYTQQLMGNSIRRSKRLRFSDGLQILSVRGSEFTEEFATLSEDLVMLVWKDFPLSHVPSWLTLKNPRVLELDGADELEELWQNNSDPPLQLSELILRNCRKLQWLPSSIRRLHHLKRLVAHFPGSSLTVECWGLQSLENSRLYAPFLSSLPDGFDDFTSLRNIDLHNCKRLNMLPDSFSQQKHLINLNLSNCETLSSLPDDFGNLTSLRSIDLGYCKGLKMLPASFSQLLHLTDLYLSNCEQIEELPSFADLPSLKSFIMWDCPKVEKIEGLEHAKSLNKLWVETRWKVPGIQGLENVERLHLKCETISALKPCIQSIKGKESPRSVWIQGGVNHSKESIVNTLELEFSDLKKVVWDDDDWDGLSDDDDENIISDHYDDDDDDDGLSDDDDENIISDHYDDDDDDDDDENIISDQYDDDDDDDGLSDDDDENIISDHYDDDDDDENIISDQYDDDENIISD
ncbi:hypothetical protein SUGI_0954730 [Cryptomeria japonica]|nr:hypothetical protein SUGI_0954730 [Cryptomeria japonica]